MYVHCVMVWVSGCEFGHWQAPYADFQMRIAVVAIVCKHWFMLRWSPFGEKWSNVANQNKTFIYLGVLVPFFPLASHPAVQHQAFLQIISAFPAPSWMKESCFVFFLWQALELTYGLGNTILRHVVTLNIYFVLSFFEWIELHYPCLYLPIYKERRLQRERSNSGMH